VVLVRIFSYRLKPQLPHHVRNLKRDPVKNTATKNKRNLERLSLEGKSCYFTLFLPLRCFRLYVVPSITLLPPLRCSRNYVVPARKNLQPTMQVICLLSCNIYYVSIQFFTWLNVRLIDWFKFIRGRSFRGGTFRSFTYINAIPQYYNSWYKAVFVKCTLYLFIRHQHGSVTS